ncbi:hypothetical protein V1264_012653 [Littorina saxatilis]|uniref:Uncharacterized protein n=1 Tax=Littorina saxatilis TaxID=31220 RepID=A0AAN9BXV1_9CAEN
MIRMTFSTRRWSANPDDLPELSYINIVNYFVLCKSAYRNTCEQLKSLQQFGFLPTFCLWLGDMRDVKCYSPDGCQNSVISAKILHSHRLNEPALSPWIIATSDVNILAAHCTCMAGVGETGMAGVGETCTHVRPFTFKESAVECAVADRHFCLESNSEGMLCLRKDHQYFL